MRVFCLSICLLIVAFSVNAAERGHLYAHRGGAHEFEENTMEAFRGSYDAGLRGFETDVRMTKDGVLVILHDDKLERTYNATGSVEEMTADELRAVTSKKKGQRFLFLDELLTFLADKPGIYLELEMKTSNKQLYPDARLDEYCRKLLAAANAAKGKDSSYFFTSFDDRPLKIIKALDPHADIMFISGGPCNDELIKKGKELGAKRIAFKMDGTSRAAVRDAHKAGLLVNGWPGHTLEDYHLAIGLGIDGICSDIPVAVQQWKSKHK